MGRAERRRTERRQRIETRKGKILISRDDLNKMKKDITYEASGYNTEALMTCFALAEHRLYGFEAEQIGESLRFIDSLMTAILDGSATMEDYMKELEDSAGVIVRCDE